MLIVLRADDHGEGGTFALYARVARVAKLPTPVATEQEYDTNLARFGAKMEKGVRPSIATHVRPLPPPPCSPHQKSPLTLHMSPGPQCTDCCHHAPGGGGRGLSMSGHAVSVAMHEGQPTQGGAFGLQKALASHAHAHMHRPVKR